MAESVSIPEHHLRRRDQFREYMRSFNPTAPAREMIAAGWVYENLHSMLFQNLAARADLEPGSQQLLIGGIGSGKTTELLLAAQWLDNQKSGLPLYIDITSETDLSGLNSGALLASFGIHLLRRISRGQPKSENIREIGQRIKEYAFGTTKTVWVSETDDDWIDVDDLQDLAEDGKGYFKIREIPGKLKPPLPALSRDVRNIREPLERLLDIARTRFKDIVVIFDGLDRLISPDKFWSVAHQDLRVFRSLKISILATAPISVLFGSGVGRTISDQFDRVHHLSVIASDPRQEFLQSVLKKRGGYRLLNSTDGDAICHYSGGVLRDLISLARDAAEEAYVAGRERISSEDIENVTRQLGTSYLRGLGRKSIRTLLELEKNKAFQASYQGNLELLVTRRVLEYSSTDFRVHPALLSVIPRAESKNE